MDRTENPKISSEFANGGEVKEIDALGLVGRPGLKSPARLEAAALWK